MRISDWSSDVCSSDLGEAVRHERGACVACPLRGHEDVDVADEACRRIGMECIDQAGGPLEEHRIHAVVGKDCCHAVDAVENPRVALCVEIADGSEMIRDRSEEHTSELQSLMRISYAVFCLKKKNMNTIATIVCLHTHRDNSLNEDRNRDH